jgi:hypothetical protein
VSLIIFLESLKIHKLRHERTIQLWFVALYIINLLPLILPVGDKDFSALLLAVDAMLGGDFSVQPAWELLTRGNWLILGLMMLTYVITLFFTLMYATLYVGEKDGMTPGEAVRRSLRALPRLFALLLLLAVPAMMTVMLAFIPLIIFFFMMYFLPLNLTLERQALLPAMQASFESTRRKKLFIFFKVLLVSFVLQLPRNMIQSLVSAALPFYALNTFFIVLQAFVMARLMGILYLHLVKKVPFVIPSNGLLKS